VSAALLRLIGSALSATCLFVCFVTIIILLVAVYVRIRISAAQGEVEGIVRTCRHVPKTCGGEFPRSMACAIHACLDLL
jgi:hypothetical protein